MICKHTTKKDSPRICEVKPSDFPVGKTFSLNVKSSFSSTPSLENSARRKTPPQQGRWILSASPVVHPDPLSRPMPYATHRKIGRRQHGLSYPLAVVGVLCLAGTVLAMEDHASNQKHLNRAKDDLEHKARLKLAREDYRSKNKNGKSYRDRRWLHMMVVDARNEMIGAVEERMGTDSALKRTYPEDIRRDRATNFVNNLTCVIKKKLNSREPVKALSPSILLSTAPESFRRYKEAFIKIICDDGPDSRVQRAYCYLVDAFRKELRGCRERLSVALDAEEEFR